jgi:adenylate cyclase
LKRRLAAILAADVVGYSRLMGVDEAGTLERLKALRKELVQPRITERKGRVVKLMGDGLLAEFPSVVEAVKCAVDIQRGMNEREPDLTDQERIRLRIGVNLGDIIVEGSDIYGNGVNVAARLEGLADPGTICVSGTVFDHVKAKVDLDFVDLGEQVVKNIEQPVQVYRIALNNEIGAKTTAAALVGCAPVLKLPNKPSIAVLPFDNMSGDPDQDYFADGITEDIITELSRFQSIFVIARNSAFAYQGRAVRALEVGQDLGVRYVVKGSVRKAKERVRVTAQLIDAQSGKHIWAERYDRNFGDIFELQDELTQSIVATLPGRVEGADIDRIKTTPYHNISAYDCILRAKFNHHRGTLEDNAEGQRLIDQAINADPECASAYAWKACIINQAGARGYIEFTEELDNKLYQYVLKGLSLDENDLECVRILCEFRIMQNRLEDALVLNDRALRINSNDPRFVAQRGEVLTWLGRPGEGMEWVLKAMRLDPYDADAWAHLLGRALFGARQYRDALTAFKRVPVPPYSQHALMAACHIYLDDHELAAAEGAEILRLKPNFRSGEFCEALFYKDDADRQHVHEGLSKVGLPE